MDLIPVGLVEGHWEKAGGSHKTSGHNEGRRGRQTQESTHGLE
jgi:hypothetical protein